MENRVRDLEQLEEQDPSDRGRRIGSIIMATLGMVGLTFAMGVVVGKAAEPKPDTRDPLDQLDRIAAAGAVKADDNAKPSGKAPELAVKAVEANELTFPKSLTEDEDRPEVIAALEAAAREEASLAATKAATKAGSKAALDAPSGLQPMAAAADDAEDSDDDAQPGSTAKRTALPASVAAGLAGRTLEKQAKHDQLVADALPEASPQERAPHGEEGEYTLQVISYDNSPAAQSFASALRAKGYEAFVTSVDLPDRGRYYRVRIGPFKTKEKAEAYRSKIDSEEHMNTIVVKRPKDEAKQH